jgi:Ca2+-binding EF-hand superfamily protein
MSYKSPPICFFAPQLSYENVLTNTTGQLKKDRAHMAEINAPARRNDTFAIGKEQAAPRPSKGARPLSRSEREPNPITGGYNDDSRRSKSVNRSGARPSSAGADGRRGTVGFRSSTPGARPGSADGGKRRVGGGGGGAGGGVPNARYIAAEAIGSDNGGIVEKVRQKILERGGANGIKSLARLLAIMDDNGDKRLSKSELEYGLRDYGIELTKSEVEQVFVYFDRDRNGSIDFTEFLVGIRGPISASRKKFIRMAFNILDTDRSGVVTADEIMSKYDFTWHPEVRGGRKTVKEAAKDFMQQWDRQEADGLVTYEEFEDYYKDISASVDDDTYFELMIRNAWRIAGNLLFHLNFSTGTYVHQSPNRFALRRWNRRGSQHGQPAGAGDGPQRQTGGADRRGRAGHGRVQHGRHKGPPGAPGRLIDLFVV